MRALTSMLLATALAAPAQQVGTNKNPGAADTFTLSVKSQLVIETVTVKDKQGKPIQGLTAKCRPFASRSTRILPQPRSRSRRRMTAT